MKKGLITLLSVVFVGGVLILTGCPVTTVEPPSVSWSPTDDQGGITFSWDEIQDVDGYIIRYNETEDTIETTTYTITEPTAHVEIVAYAGSEESNPWSEDFAAVETKNIDWYTRADSDPTHPSGLGINNDGRGSVVTISYAEGDHNEIDFVAEYDNTITAIQESDPQVNKNNGVAYESTYDYSTMKIAPSTGYENFEEIVEGGTFVLLKDPDGEKNDNDRYAKLKVIGINQTRWTIDITVQPIGGLRWLVK